MATHAVYSGASTALPSPRSSERAEARLAAHRLVQAVQLRDTGDELGRRLEEAEALGWGDVARVLLYADVVRAWIAGGGDREVTIDRLYERAERDGDAVLLASALASRAEYRFGSGSASVREQANRDLARAAAMLEVAEGGALERGTAYIDCALAYAQRELWELANEMYGRAEALMDDCEEPLLDGPLRLNHATVQVCLACSLREVGDQDGLDRLRQVVRSERLGRPTLAERTGVAFDLDERVALHLLDRLLGLAPTESAATLDDALSVAGSPYEQPVHGLLRLADAVYAADQGDWDEVSRQTSTAVLQLEDDIGPPIIAMTLRLATQAELAHGTGGADTALAYCDWSARRRWDARMQLLTAARASYEAEQLRVERDHNAHQAHVDELTGLANRRGYVRHIELLQAQSTLVPLAVLVVDVDAFKSVNDRFGHPVGDGVLVKVAEVLASGTRSRDLVARLGGDEFVVLLDGLAADAARRRATDMLERLGRVDWADLADGLDVSISIGLARGSYADPGPLLDRADRALYETKRRGGGGVTVAAEG